MTEGILDIRGPAEPAPMEKPTTITGTNDGGQITSGTLTTPTVSFTQRITSPAVTDVRIDAAFSLVSPNSLRGSIDEDRNVRLAASLRVDLTVRVDILPNEVYRCVASPVNLVLEGHHDGTVVTLRAPNFTVPAVPETGTCRGIIADGINGQIEGAGHSLTLTMAGDLTAPLAPGEETVTTLAVSPTGDLAYQTLTTLTARVAPGSTATNTDVPTGLVEFLDGDTTLGQVELDEDGMASLVTDALQPGIRILTVEYLGSAPIYAVSRSANLIVRVVAPPVVTVDLSSAVQIDSSVDFTTTVRHGELGDDIAAARLEVVIQRVTGAAQLNSRVTFAVLDGDEVVPVPLTVVGAGLKGVIDPADGLPVVVGTARAIRARLSLSAAVTAGPLQVTMALVDPGTGLILGEGQDVIDMVTADRFVAPLTAGVTLPNGNVVVPAIVPVRARVGQVVEFNNLGLSPTIQGVRPTGSYEFSVDGQLALVREASEGADQPWRPRLDLPVSGVFMQLPRSLRPGTHQVVVAYSGDRFYAPATAMLPLAIEVGAGPLYECVHNGAFSSIVYGYIEGRSILPVAAAPPSVPLTATTLNMRFARGLRNTNQLAAFSADPNAEVRLDFASGGTAEGTGIVRTNATIMTTDQPSTVDYIVSLVGITGDAAIAGAPGDVVDVSVERITFTYVESAIGATNTLTCEPVDAPLSYGEVDVAGLSIEAPAAVAAGRDVEISATVHPAAAGIFEAVSNERTVGFAATQDGTATIKTHGLDAGDTQVSVHFYPAGPTPQLTSVPMTIRVVATCAPVEEGLGASVRLVYMELLGRCPDAAGYEYWTGQLDGGLSPETFAQRISASLEARKVIVADAYRLLLDRAPDAAGATFWAERLGRNARYDDLLASIAASAEFRQRAGGTDTGVVTRLYERIIGRAPDTAGRDYWVDVLRTRGITQVVRSFVNLPEPLAAIVTSSYEDLLGRAPTADERTAGVDALRATGDRSALYASIIATDDFADRAQEFPEFI